MIAFVISFILIFVSSYFISSVLAKQNALKGFIYTFLIAFCQIILTSEILSIFNQIKVLPYLALNLVFFLISISIWIKYNKPLFKPDLKDFARKLFNSIKLDKSLFFLLLGWLIFINVALILIILLPTTSGDAFDYHVVRCYDWVMNHSLQHFETADIRINAFPINSELLYLWILVFTKKQLCLGIFSFVGYLLFLTSSFQIFKYIGYSMRKTLWTHLIISSFASVVVMVSGTETDLIIAGLITTSIYLFINGLKNKSDNVTLFMASLAYALAIGTKTPAILCIPAVGILFTFLSLKYKDKFSLLKFIGFGIFNFLLFSSFNFILNFIDYGNIMGTEGCINTHKNLWGIQGLCATLIKHIFLLVDFSGFNCLKSVSKILIDFENNILETLNFTMVPNGLFSGDFYFNTSLIEPMMGCGILSFLLIIPCWLLSLLTPIFKRNKINKIQFIFASIFTINLVVLSAYIVFMIFSTRFITSFILISAPMLACSYIKSNKNPIKIMYVLIAFFYFTIVSTNLWGRPFFIILKSLKNQTLTEFRSKVNCAKFNKQFTTMDDWCTINGILDSKFYDKNYKVLILPRFSENIIYTKIKQMQGYNYRFINAENLHKINVDEYDIIIMPKGSQPITNFEKYSSDKIDYYMISDVKGNIIDYYPNNPDTEVACYYRSVGGVISKQMFTDKESPTVKVCALTVNFFKKHPFAFVYKTDKYFFILNTNTFPEYEELRN